MKLFAFDTEFDLFQEGIAVPPMVCGSFSDGETDTILLPDETAAYVRELLLSGATLTGQNLAIDLAEACRQDPSLLDLVFQAGDEDRLRDIGIAEGLHDLSNGMLFVHFETGDSFAKKDPETGEMSGRYALDYMVLRHFNADIAEEKYGDRSWRKRYALLRGLPLDLWPEDARSYPKYDARFTYRIDRSQVERGYRNQHDLPRQVRASLGLQLMKTWGFRTDGVYLADLEAKVDADWYAAREKFLKAGLYRIETKFKGKPNEESKYVKNTKVVKDLVVEAYDGDPPLTEKEGVSTDRDTLTESGVPILIELGKSGKNDKRKTLYVPLLSKGIDVPLTPEFNVLVDTGRISSNMQQLPQKGGIREAIVARSMLPSLKDLVDDVVLCSCDYEGLELRTMAQRAIWDPDVGFSKMAEMINTGKDVHTHVAAFFLGCTYEELKAKVDSKDPVAVAFRALAKIFNFGKGGGMGAKTLAYNARSKDDVRFCLLAKRAEKCGVEKVSIRVQGKFKRLCVACAEVAQELDSKWYEAWPEQMALKQKAQDLCPRDKLTGEQTLVECVVPWSNRVRGGCSYTQWLNTPFQGMGGDGVKLAQWRIQREMYTDRRSPLWGSRLILNVHDELIAELREIEAHEAGFRMAEIMVQAMSELTPDCKNKVEPAFARRAFKSASLVKSQDGRSAPWWPRGELKDANGKVLEACKGPSRHLEMVDSKGNPKDCGCWKWEPDQAVMWRDIERWKVAV